MVLRVESDRPRPGMASASDRDVPARRESSGDGRCEPSRTDEGGVIEDRNRLVQDNLHLVITIAREFRGRGLELDDLAGEGSLGLIRAAERFDPRMGTRFSSYAAYWIRDAMRRALMNTASTIRLPAHLFRLMSKWRQAERSLRERWGRSPAFEEVAAVLGLSVAQRLLVARAIQAGQLKLESSYSVESGSRLSEEVVDRCRPIDERLEADEERADAFRLMGMLDDQERAILKLHYGLEGNGLTLREIGRRLGVSGEWVRRIERRAISKLSNAPDDRAAGPRSRGAEASRGG